MPSIEPVFGRRALLLEGRALLVADLHIGVEYELEKKGIRIPSQWKDMVEEILSIKEESGADVLIINGDLKHSIPSERWEFRDLRLFFREIRHAFDEIHFVKGNHDGGIQYQLPSWVYMHPGAGFVFSDAGIFHGHAWPSEEVMNSEVLIMAHMHPALSFTDSIGNSQTEPCWIKGRYAGKELIVMPAMNRFYGGAPVNDRKFLGPVLKSADFDAENAEIYLLDGTYMGKIGEMD